MTKVKKAILMIVLLLLTVTLCLTAVNGKISKAETAQEDDSAYGSESEEVTPRGIYTNLTLAIDGGNGQVWATAKNKFTLFPSTVTVRIELYRSDVYQESYSDMTLVASNYIYDLDQGNSISAVYQTNGKQSYWKARMYYNIDNDGWEEKVTSTSLYDQYGIKI